jgi:ribokinase
MTKDEVSLPDICVLGSVNLDLIIQTQVLPRAGETVTQGQFTALPGGKGANVALAAKRLGAKVSLQAAVGHDDYADQALRFLKEASVDLSNLIMVEDVHTGLAFINVADDGENQIAVASGANAVFTPEKLKPISNRAIISQFEIPIETIKAAIEGFDGFVALNTSPVLPGLDTVMPYADLLILNEGEYDAYQSLLDGFEGMVAITLGAAGATLMQKGQILATAKPPQVDVVDTTGAGDSFAAGLTVALVEGQSYEKALSFACAVGALTATKIGTQSAAPNREDVDNLV